MSRTYKIFKSEQKAIESLKLNQPRRVRIGDLKIVLVRTTAGITAMNDLCPHQSASLSDGFTNDFGEIICPLHEYRFNLKTGQESSGRCPDAITYPVDNQMESGVFITV